MTLKELRNKKAELATRIKAMGEQYNSDGFTPDDEWKSNWSKLNADYDELLRQIDVVERLEQFGKEDEEAAEKRRRLLGQPNGSPSVKEADRRRLAFSGWARCRKGLATPAEIEAMAEFGLLADQSVRFDLLTSEQREEFDARVAKGEYREFVEQYTQSAVIGELGGFTVPMGFVPRVERALLAFGDVMQAAEVLRTDREGDLPWPTSDDTSNEGRQVGETQKATKKDITFDRMVLKAYRFTSDLVDVPIELMQDSAINIEAFVSDRLGERLRRVLNRKFTVGTGAATPMGIHTAATATTAEANSAAPWQALLDLIHSVDPGHRANARFMGHDHVLRELRKMKDGDGRPIWQPSIRDGTPDLIHAYPFLPNNHMPAIDDDKADVIFGDLSKYKVRLIRAIRIERDKDIEADSEKFVGYVRADGNLLDPGGNAVRKIELDFSASES